MSRVIKFRVWDTLNNKWMDTFRFIEQISRFNCNSGSILIDNGVQTHYVIQQFTGLLDKDDKEIFEGDILYTNFGKEGSEDDPFIEIYCAVTNQHGGWKYNGDFLYYYCAVESTVKIVGNIYQTPELLNKQNN